MVWRATIQGRASVSILLHFDEGQNEHEVDVVHVSSHERPVENSTPRVRNSRSTRYNKKRRKAEEKRVVHVADQVRLSWDEEDEHRGEVH